MLPLQPQVMKRIRLSLQEVENKYITGENKALLKNLIRAFRGIQDLPPTDKNSFEYIAGCHGMPFRGKGVQDPGYWGGFCTHETVLFPTWHRIYLFRLEDALRTIDGCEDVTVPFWDQTCLNNGLDDLQTFLPAILTKPTFELDGRSDNPLYSYKLQQAMSYNIEGGNERHTKPVGYETVRYPLSGLVGTEDDRKATATHNSRFPSPEENAKILGCNVASWHSGTVVIPNHDDNPKTVKPETTSVSWRYRRCLEAPNYTVFSNIASQRAYIAKSKPANGKFDYPMSLESPHDAIHLAAGGYYLAGKYNASVLGSSGDLGANEMASFDPMFWFHHSFVDYTFWMWQQIHGCTTEGSLKIISGYAGTKLPVGMPNMEKGAELTTDTALYPFRRQPKNGEASPGFYTSRDVTDIENQLGYTYGPGSLDDCRMVKEAPIVKMKRVHNINRADFSGSFVVRTYATGPSGRRIEVGREPILSRWRVKQCPNCRNHLDVECFVPLDSMTLDYLYGGHRPVDNSDHEVVYDVEISTSDGIVDPAKLEIGRQPIVSNVAIPAPAQVRRQTGEIYARL